MSKNFIFLAFAATFALCWAESKYFVATPRVIRPGEITTITVTFTDLTRDVRILVELIDQKGEKLGTTGKEIISTPGKTTVTSSVDVYITPKLTSNTATLRVKASGGVSFNKVLTVTVEKVSETIFIQTDKPIYKPGETIKFRAIGIDRSLLPINDETVSEIAITNPGGSRVMQWLNVQFDNGMISEEFPLSTRPVLGTWKLSLTFNGKKTIQTVEVEKYVLPKFEVTASTPKYILKKQEKVPVTVCAKYTYGKDVTGTVTAKICLDSSYNWLRNRLQKSCMLVNDLKIKGCTDIDFDIANMGLSERYFYYSNIVVKVDANVKEDATGVTLNGTHTSVPLSKYDIQLKIEMDKFYKPGFPISVKVLATTPDGRPTRRTAVTLTWRENYNQKWNRNVVIKNGVYTFTENTVLDSTSYKVEALYKPELKQSSKSQFNAKKIVLNPYGRDNVRASQNSYPWVSNVKKFLKISDVKHFETGKNVEIVIKASPMTEPITINHILVCNGKVMKTLSERFDFTKHVLSFKVTDKMTPKCRFLTYIVYNGELIADNMILTNGIFELKNQASISFDKDTSRPGGKVKITLRASPDSKFAISAVDKSVQLLGETNDIRKDQVLGVLTALDVDGTNLKRKSCRDGGSFRFWGGHSYASGADGFKAISETGLVYFSDISTDIVPCPEIYPVLRMNMGNRRVMFKNKQSKVPSVKETIETSGKVYLDDEKKKAIIKKPPMKMRTEFPETWLWNDGNLDPFTGEKVLEVNIPDTITTWFANGVALSKTTGIGISTPTSIKAFQPFFASIHLPYSVVRGETVKVTATVFNYMDKCLPILMEITTTEDFKLIGSPSVTMCVCGSQSKTHKFKIKPTKLGYNDITIKAITTSTTNVCSKENVIDTQTIAQDGLTKKLLVEAEGIKKDSSTSTFFCLDNEARKEVDKVTIELPPPVVPGSVYARLSVVGDLLGPSISGLDKLLAMPYGCGEQNMLKFAPNIYVMDYLTATNQVTQKIKNDATKFMRAGYQRELTYKHKNGAYSAFGERDKQGSTWLTAFVLRSYSQAQRYIYIDPADIKISMQWLMGLQDTTTGCFRDVGMVHHKEMKGGVTSGATMTAFVLTALLEAGLKTSDSVVLKALECVKKDLDNVNDPYTAAVLAYTLTLAGDTSNKKMLDKLNEMKVETESGSLIHWEGKTDTPKQSEQTTWCTIQKRPVDIETTAYGLMAFSGGKRPYANKMTTLKILKWLAKQRNSYGGFASTQDTCVGLQALANYAAGAFRGLYDLKIFTRFSHNSLERTFDVTDANKMVLQRTEVTKVPTGITIEASGTGCALVQTTVKYNIPVEKDVPAFILTHVIKPHETFTFSCKHTLRVCGSFDGKTKKSNMAIIDVTMVSGFEPVLSEEDLGSPFDATFTQYEFENGVLSMYFDEFDGTPKCVDFNIEQVAEVEDRQPAKIKVYDYYDTENSATVMYSVNECPELNIVA